VSFVNSSKLREPLDDLLWRDVEIGVDDGHPDLVAKTDLSNPTEAHDSAPQDLDSGCTCSLVVELRFAREVSN
jgi:hypothetical protein